MATTKKKSFPANTSILLTKEDKEEEDRLWEQYLGGL